MKVIRKVVGHEERPYARDEVGNILTVTMDVLECGHRLPASNRKLLGAKDISTTPLRARERHCNYCTKEAEQADG